MTIDPYVALALQAPCWAVNLCKTPEEARQRMHETIDYCGRLIKGSKGFIRTFSGDEARLVVLPEYFLTSFPLGESVDSWIARGCVAADGPEYEALARIAQDNHIYLSGNLYETDPHFPEIYFQTSFILSDTGEQILRYRRLVSMFAPTPHDILDRYLDVYGADALFPVADTPIGRLACVASEEILYPEITRCLALRGAEVICHSSSEVTSPLATPKNIAKQARAYENMLYVVSANSACIHDIPFPKDSTGGGSRVVDYKGQVLAEAAGGESMCGNAEVDIDALRRTRRRPAMTNMLARQRLDLFAPTYAEGVYPANNMLVEGDIRVPDRSHFMATQQAVIDGLVARGII
ncbi:MAG: nitrilase-related carbon-nitrogen hydrolase [Chromatocurvus sp.]